MAQPPFFGSARRKCRSLIVHYSFMLLVGLLPVQIRAVVSAPEAGGGQTAPDVQEVRQLEPERSIERELAGGEFHLYRLTLDAGQYAKLTVDQLGIDVMVRLSGPDGKQIMDFDTESRPRGEEAVEQVAEVAGEYRLTVQPKQRGAAAGGYRIRLMELRVATESDRLLQEARRLTSDVGKMPRTSNFYDEAIRLFERVLEIRERLLGPDHRAVALTLNNLAGLNWYKGDYVTAESLFQRALVICEKALEPEHPETARTLLGLATVYRDRGEYAKAEPLFQRAQVIYEKAFGLEHPDLAKCLYGLAILYRNRDEFEKAEPLLRRSLTIWEKALGPEHPLVAGPLNGLAIIYKDRGAFTAAEPLFQRSLGVMEKAMGRNHPDLAPVLNNLAAFYNLKGDYASAEPLFQRALTIREKALGPEHPDLATSLHDFANFYREIGKYAQAEPLFQRALTIREKALGPEHPLLATTLRGLAALYRDRGEYVKAEPLFQRALTIQEQALGPEHTEVADCLNDLAVLYLNTTEYEKAEPLFQRALTIREKVQGPESPLVASILGNLAKSYEATGKIARAIAFQSRANAISEGNITLNLAVGSERQKLAYLALYSKATDFTLSLHCQSAPADPQALDLAFTTLLQRKGRGLEAMIDAIGALRSHAMPEDQQLFARLAEARARLAMFTLQESDSIKRGTYRAKLKPLQEKVEAVEATLSARSEDFRLQKQPVTLASVQAALPVAGVLIEFAVVTPQSRQAGKSQAPRYLAYLLAAQGPPRWVDLGETAPIDEAIAAWRKALRDPRRSDAMRLARAVDEQVMRPVRASLQSIPGVTPGGIRHLLIAPDGSLNLIPFAALVDERNRYLVEHDVISYLTSGRDLLRAPVLRHDGNAPLIVANPAYGRPATVAARAGQTSGGSEAAKPLVDQGRSRIEPGQMLFQPLPGTAGEAEAIKSLLPDAKVLQWEQATEAAVKEARAPSILHIATHGFFLSYQEPRPAETRDALGADLLRSTDLRMTRWVAQIEDPLLRSGLALAGANQGRSGNDDGVLTALEAAGLDLWGTELVVLSACDTGVGEVRNGDGVYGLRRALTLAGSETQVMSLWPVSDNVTRVLMAAYYEGLKQGRGRGEALRAVQLEMLKTARRQHPFFWAAFVQSGEWANLEGRR